jgi:hypothetical protein
MFIPDPDFIHPGSRISDPTTTTKEKGEIFVALPFCLATHIAKNINYFILKQVQEKIEPIDKEF